jgi:hypothetical protein
MKSRASRGFLQKSETISSTNEDASDLLRRTAHRRIFVYRQALSVTSQHLLDYFQSDWAQAPNTEKVFFSSAHKITKRSDAIGANQVRQIRPVFKDVVNVFTFKCGLAPV